MISTSFTNIPDAALLHAAALVAADERRSTAELLAILGEIDVRRLYLGEGYASLFAYCTQVLHFSEHAAYHRIEGARAAQQFPIILRMIVDGSLTLTTVALLRSHLTPANHEAVLTAAKHKSKRDVEHQIAALAPRVDVQPLIRRMPDQTSPTAAAAPRSTATTVTGAGEPLPVRPARAPQPIVAPLAPDRYLLKITVSGETEQKLRHAQALMRHSLPAGDPGVIIDRALTLLIEQLERTKIAKTDRPRPSAPPNGHSRTTRRIPAALRRAVWARDDGRCAFVGSRGRCGETGGLEFHHLVPFADGGQTKLENLALRCRAHHRFESERWFGPWQSEATAATDALCR